MKKLIHKILKESDFGWVDTITSPPNYKGNPQGVVHLREHDEIDEFMDLIVYYNGGEEFTSVNRDNYHEVLEDIRDRHESGDSDTYDDWVPSITVSFFISKKDPTKYDSGYWDYDVDEDTVEDWLVNGACEEEVVDCDNWKLYTDISQVRPLLSERLVESDDFGWTVDVKSDPNFNYLEGQPFIIEWKDGRVVDKGWSIGKVVKKNGKEYILIKGNKDEPWSRWKLILAFRGKMKKYKFKFKDDEIQRNWTLNESNDFEWTDDAPTLGQYSITDLEELILSRTLRIEHRIKLVGHAKDVDISFDDIGTVSDVYEKHIKYQGMDDDMDEFEYGAKIIFNDTGGFNMYEYEINDTFEDQEVLTFDILPRRGVNISDIDYGDMNESDFGWAEKIGHGREIIINGLNDFIKQSGSLAEVDMNWERTNGGGTYFGKIWLYDRFYEMFEYDDTFTVRFFGLYDEEYDQYDSYEGLTPEDLLDIMTHELTEYEKENND